MDFCILHTVLLVMILLFIIDIICYHYAKHRSKQKTYCCTNSIKVEKNEFKNVSIKGRTCYNFNDN